MTTVLLLLASIFALPAVVFALYRYSLPLLSLWKSPVGSTDTVEEFTVGLVTVSHVASEALAEKLKQFSQLQADLATTSNPVTSLYIGLDGAEVPTGEAWKTLPLTWFASAESVGKNHKLAEIVATVQATDNAPGVLIFTDVDAQVDSVSLRALLARFREPGVGAVTGRRQIQDNSEFAAGQIGYISADDHIREQEMRYLKAVTSSDGKLYAIRRELIDALPADVTDDLYTALGAVASGYRLVSAPDAVAIIGRPARDRAHDLIRRRRVTTRGLSTVWRRRGLMNPLRTGGYGPALFINKVLRRLAAPGLLLAAVCVGSWIAVQLFVTHMLLFVLLAAVSLGAVYALMRKATIRYLVLGMVGMSLGVWDFLCGKRISRWEPRKQAVSGTVNCGNPTDA